MYFNQMIIMCIQFTDSKPSYASPTLRFDSVFRCIRFRIGIPACFEKTLGNLRIISIDNVSFLSKTNARSVQSMSLTTKNTKIMQTRSQSTIPQQHQQGDANYLLNGFLPQKKRMSLAKLQ